jgi:hypothetical protein
MVAISRGETPASHARARRPNGPGDRRRYLVNIRSKVRIISEALHDRNSLPLTIANDTPECFDIGQCIDQRRSEARTSWGEFAKARVP